MKWDAEIITVAVERERSRVRERGTNELCPMALLQIIIIFPFAVVSGAYVPPLPLTFFVRL